LEVKGLGKHEYSIIKLCGPEGGFAENLQACVDNMAEDGWRYVETAYVFLREETRTVTVTVVFERKRGKMRNILKIFKIF